MDFGTLFLIVNAAIPLTLIFSALLMLLIAVPPTSGLENYRTSRKALAYAYLIFGILSGANAIMNGSNTSESDMLIVAIITLTISSFQSYLFTYTLIILINPLFIVRRWLTYQLLPISIFSTLSIFLLFFSIPSLQDIVFYLFLLFYIYQLVFYTYTFIKEYKQYHSVADNYFSGDETRHLNWVAIAFFSALGIGILAFSLIIFTDPVYDLIVAILCGVFYACFLIKYINYPYTFNKVIIQEEKLLEDVDVNENKTQNSLSLSIEQWVSSKAYTEPNITIISVAGALNTNRTYLSAYINNNMQVNFSSWINILRINDAKKILRESPNLPIADISTNLGYADHSSFSRQFKKITGFSPIDWRNKN
ncbi:MAG: helix-turn-helix domain-containing protein [Dysgonomonas sp.]